MADPVCTGVAASWCPRCGDCACRDEEGELRGEGLNHPDCPLHAPGSQHAEARWLLFCAKEAGHGEVCLWWGPNSCGYTTDLDAAGRYTDEDARRYSAASYGGSVVAVLAAELEERARRVVPLNTGDWNALRAYRERRPNG